MGKDVSKFVPMQPQHTPKIFDMGNGIKTTMNMHQVERNHFRFCDGNKEETADITPSTLESDVSAVNPKAGVVPLGEDSLGMECDIVKGMGADSQPLNEDSMADKAMKNYIAMQM